MRALRSAFVLATLAAMAACGDEATEPSTPVLGTTPGWFNGRTVTFSYTAAFQCTAVPGEPSGAASGCSLAVEPTTRPSAPELDPTAAAPVVYVMVPLFEPAPPASTLHCPANQTCITHPPTMDLSRVFGAGTANAALPAHSHIVGQLAGNLWEIEVVGVTTRAAWDDLVNARSLQRVRQLQAQENSPLTDDIPSNLFLFFDVEDRAS